MSTTFYVRVPIVIQHGIGNHQVGFTWFQKLPEYLKLVTYRDAEIMDEYGTIYTQDQFADEVGKGSEQSEEVHG